MQKSPFNVKVNIYFESFIADFLKSNVNYFKHFKAKNIRLHASFFLLERNIYTAGITFE
jgi:hypothetical protein